MDQTVFVVSSGLSNSVHSREKGNPGVVKSLCQSVEYSLFCHNLKYNKLSYTSLSELIWKKRSYENLLEIML